MRYRRTRISILGCIFLLFSLTVNSQFNTYSPYTRFGLGDLSHGGFGQNQAMGGTGIAIRDGSKLNYLNPAAYAARDSMSVLLDFGINTYRNQYNTTDLSTTWTNVNLDHFAFSAPIGKYFALGTGIVPYSSVGYKIKQEYDELGTGDAIDLYFNGDGGILKYFLGASVELFNRVSLGVNMNYLLGNINRERSMQFPRNRGFAETYAIDEIDLSHTYFGFGIMYKEVIADKFFFTLGGIYDLQTNLNSAFTQTITNKFPGRSSYIDSVYISNVVDIVSDKTEETITVPAKTGVGIAFGIPNKLTITGDYYMQDWETVNNSALSAEGFDLANTRSIHAGIEFIPDFEAFRGYHNLISYRLGGFYKDSYVKVGKYQLNDYGMTFGVGFPIGKTKSSLNVAFTLGTRGTTENNLVKENYGILSFNVTLHDLWFYKRKFD
ncbi:MAG: hypothetical protein K9J30_07580 [Bacteroidales bacterium]|nr:hypothetical protein [Bacteroidales bacterium]